MTGVPRVLVIGSWNRDITGRVARPPGLGVTVAGARMLFAHGDQGSNQAMRQGARFAKVAALGEDVARGDALRFWRAEGVDVGTVRRGADIGTGVAPVAAEPSAEGQIIVAAGANASLKPATVE